MKGNRVLSEKRAGKTGTEVLPLPLGQNVRGTHTHTHTQTHS